MERSTPINYLQRGNQAEEMVDDIVEDLEEEQQYLQAQQQHPQPPMQPNQPPMQHPQPPMQPPEQQYLPQHQFQRGPPGGHQPMMRPVPPRNQPGLENESLSQRVLNEAKEPLLVSVLVIIMSSPQLQSLIARFLPIAASNPLIGLAVRAVFAGVLFWLLRRFIPSA